MYIISRCIIFLFFLTIHIRAGWKDCHATDAVESKLLSFQIKVNFWNVIRDAVIHLGCLSCKLVRSRIKFCELVSCCFRTYSVVPCDYDWVDDSVLIQTLFVFCGWYVLSVLYLSNMEESRWEHLLSFQDPFYLRSVSGFTHILNYFDYRMGRLLFICGDVDLNPGPVYDTIGNNDHTPVEKQFSVFHANVRSLRFKMDILQAEVDGHDYDIIAITESWLNPNIKNEDIRLPGYRDPIRKDRSETTGGGVCLYVKESIVATRKPMYEINGIECLCVEFNLQTSRLLVCVCYNPKKVNPMFWSKFDEMIEIINDDNYRNVVVLGDLNHDFLSDVNHTLFQTLETYNYSQLITEPTRITETSQTLLDPIVVSDKSLVTDCGVTPPFCSDHCAVYASLNFSVVKSARMCKMVWRYKDTDYGKFRNLLHNVDILSLIDEEKPVDQVVDEWSSSISDIINECVPHQLIVLRPRDKPWMNNDIRLLMRKRNRAHKKALRTNGVAHWAKFRRLRNEVIDKVRKAKKQADDRNITDLNTMITGSRSWWSIVKSVMKSNNIPQSFPPICKPDGEVLNDPKPKADFINDYFCSISSVDEPDGTPSLDMINNDRPDLKLTSVQVNENEVLDQLRLLDSTKAVGPDGIAPILLRNLAPEFVPMLETLFNLSLEKNCFPSSWKRANVIPIFKGKGESTLVSNYRPVSLTSCVSKVFEKLIYNRLYNHLLDTNFLYNFQSGFLPGHSTTCQLIELCHSLSLALDNQMETSVVFCDISKAFDRVWHRGLIVKLKGCGVDGHLLSWFHSYLSNRKQRVIVDNEFSDWGYTNAGVPQGSVLGPILFLIFINDITSGTVTNFRIFADDNSYFHSSRSSITNHGIMQNDTNHVASWAKKWLVTMSVPKTVNMIVSRRRTQQALPLLMNGNDIRIVDNHTHLGLSFSSDMTWSLHIQNVVASAFKRLGILEKLKYKVSRKVLERMFISYVRSLLDYGDVVYDGCTENDKILLESVQIKAGRIITGLTRSCSRNSIYEELGWVPLSERRKRHKIIMYFKILNGKAPSYLSELIPQQVADRSGYVTRNRNDITTFRCNTEHFSRTFFPSTTVLWNSLDETIKNSTSISALKRGLSANDGKPPSWYSYGDRRCQIIHCQLRNNCSSLNNELYLNHVDINPICRCGTDYETAYHYIFNCPLHVNSRAALLDFFELLEIDLTLDVLLFGDETLPENVNIRICAAFHDFISSSKRFF